MTRRNRVVALAVAMSALAIVPVAVSAARIDKVLPYPGLDHLRLKIVLSAAGTSGDVELTGRIVPVTGGGGPPLWEGVLGKADLNGDDSSAVEANVQHLKPKLWSPASPDLYLLVVEARRNGNLLDSKSIRFGFRTFEAKDGSLHLNGRPIFIRGIAINPPGRGVPPLVGHSRKFAEDYVRFMRAHNVNMIRLEPQSDVWFDVCDELGMMIYQGVYGSPTGHEDPEEQSKTRVPPVESALIEYRNVFDDYLQHPSIVIYVLSNELPYEGKRGAEWHEFLTKVHAVLSKEYPLPFIGNAGYGQGREGDINDVHRYWGWYYNSHLTYYNLRDPLLFGDPDKAKTQPFTFSECVGAFTGPSGQFNLIFRKQLGAQLNWTGHAANQVEEAQAYQSFIFKHAAESFRTMRATNPRLSGLMPFTILFRNWRGITSFEQMGHNANADQMTRSYSPVLLSWENWTPNVYAGTVVKAVAHVVNDSEDFSDLKNVSFSHELLNGAGKVVLTGQSRQLKPVPYYGVTSSPVEIALPGALPTGRYTVRGTVAEGRKPVATNTFAVFVAGDDWKRGGLPAPAEPVQLYDRSGETAEAFKRLGIRFQKPDLGALADNNMPLVIGEGAWDKPLTEGAEGLKLMAQTGVRVLILSQPHEKFDASWLRSQIDFPKTSNNDPTYEKRRRPMRDGMHINPMRPWHPVLSGVGREHLKWWSDYTGWDQSKSGFPDIYPVNNGFRLTRAEDLAHTAIIANYDRGLEAIAVAEMFDKKGSVVMTSFNLIPRIGKDPVADRVLQNLVAYVTSTAPREVHPLIEEPIQWGNYPTEKGVVVEPLGGLVVNCRWQVPPTAPNAKPLPDNQGAWNTRPGDGYVAHGRRVFGPWTYTNATGIRDLSDPAQAAMYKRQLAGDAGTAASVPPAELDAVDNVIRKASKASPTGSGQFWAQVPPGRRWAITRVENTGDTSAKIEMQVNGGKVESVEVPKGETDSVKCSIDADATTVNVKFVADKRLVLLETSFE